MKIFVFVLALILGIAGAGGLLASLSLAPTEMGILYATIGTIAVAAGCIVAAIGALIVRIDALAPPATASPAPPEPIVAEPVAPVVAPEPAPPAARPAPEVAPTETAQAEAAPEEEDEPVNENRAGHLPSLHEVEETLAHPEPPPKLVGRYSAGGAHYMIFADGTIEAETDEGQFKFSSMSEFKAYIAQRRG